MSETISLAAEVRNITGKGAARAVRREGKLPAVLYGGDTPPEHVAINYIELLKAYNRGHLGSNMIELEINGKKSLALARDIQIHPLKDSPEHVDFLRVTASTRVTVQVPVNFTNEEESPGLKRGGVLNIVRHDVELVCPAAQIPDELEANLTGTDIGDSIKISDISLPEGIVPTITDRDFTIATIAAPSGLKSEEEEAAEAEAAEAAAAEADGEGEAEATEEGED